jgi:hypothetical protein
MEEPVGLVSAAEVRCPGPASIVSAVCPRSIGCLARYRFVHLLLRFLGPTDELVDVAQFLIKAFDIFVVQLPKVFLQLLLFAFDQLLSFVVKGHHFSPLGAMPGDGDETTYCKDGAMSKRG